MLTIKKEAFDKRVVGRAPREVIFKAGQLMQVYRSDLDYTFKATWKMEPKWSAPQCIVSHNKNSYKIETLEGLPIGGCFSSRHLWWFIPRDGTSLHAAQKVVEEALGLAEEETDAVADAERADVVVDIEEADMGGPEVVFDSNDKIASNSKDNSREEGGPGADDENGDEESNNEEESGDGRDLEERHDISEDAEEIEREEIRESAPVQENKPRRSM
ncbi:hypothetical protein CPB84DRAFT_1687342 [Gymnopilus junonius]|uniref:Uncharacterized protein n=1 Tax=Gymnopilus junonius TaxID=109634 RepID=A0A9P5THC8_GYMJU|nr:hypothetical protein CPB84DRAFT_1687342 [Gymnopilus junonius]